jgi:hypothetical protein
MPTLWRSQLWAMSGHDALKSDVRFAPESGHWWAQLVSPRLETAPNYSAITAGNRTYRAATFFKIYIMDCRNRLFVNQTYRIQYSSRNFLCIRHPLDNKPV